MPSPSIVQQVSGASAAAAPASFTLSGITATRAGTLLILHAAAATSAAGSISTPVGWTTTPNTLVNGTAQVGQSFILPGQLNGGGITSVTIATLTNVNGIACAFFEVAGMPSNIRTDTGQGATQASSTNVTSGGVTIDVGGQFWCGYEADATGQAFTLSQTFAPPNASWIADTTATSTNGATNIIIRPHHAFGPALVGTVGATVGLSGTLAGALANMGSMFSFLSLGTQFFAFGPGGQVLVTGGAGYGVGV